ncbi:MAG: hypothetical protein KAS12_02490 [Candidatus Aenigmarchaeota archaeon]|nr:hypothetical protein [Candidatus Aenigmarchaeota archaeon]
MNETVSQSVTQSVPDMWISITIFALFLFIAFFILKTVKNLIVSGILGALFPTIANSFLGMAIKTDWATSLNFALIGMALYIAYMVLSTLYRSSKLVFKLAAFVLLPLKLIGVVIKSIFGSSKKKNKQKDTKNDKE